jgi:hypothetical protein
MSRRIGAILAVVAGCGSPSGPVVELATAGQPPAEWFEPASTAQQLVLADAAPARGFIARHGGSWELDFDPLLATVRELRGPGIPFAADGTSDAELERAAVAFVREHVELFGTDELVFDGAVVDRDLWTIMLAQRHRGVPVLSAHLGLTISHGRLVLVQGSTHAIAELDATPIIGRAAAISTLQAAIAPRPQAGDRDTARLVIVPERAAGAVAYRLAWEVTAWRGLLQGLAYVDARDGRLVAVYDANHYGYAGTATNLVHERTVGDAVVTLPAGYLRLSSTNGIVTTDAAGAFAFPGVTGPLTVTANLRGRYVHIRNAGGPNASFIGMMSPDRPYELVWNQGRSMPEERDVFRAVNETNRFVASVFPDVEWIESPITANVNLQRTCNAFWNGSSINFFVAGNGCNNTGRIFDVVAHEWGHGFDTNAPGGVVDRGLGEFIGDLIGFVQTRSPLIGPGFFTHGGAVRDLEDPAFQCYDPKKREVHAAGHLLGAVVWDIHEDLVAAGVTGEHLKRLMLRPIAGAQTRAQWYSQMLAVDDDDGDLANGTPHECLIYNQFKLHSCGGTRWPGIPAKDPPHCTGATSSR